MARFAEASGRFSLVLLGLMAAIYFALTVFTREPLEERFFGLAFFAFCIFCQMAQAVINAAEAFIAWLNEDSNEDTSETEVQIMSEAPVSTHDTPPEA